VIGITATIPVEIVFASGHTVADLNNLFITAPNPQELVVRAEQDGFAHNICAWIKGIYSVTLEGGFKQIIAVTGGDCSNTVALGEVLAAKGVAVIPFAFPLDADRRKLYTQMDRLRKTLGTSWGAISQTKSRLDRIRAGLRRLDELTYLENRVSGLENHRFLVSSSDFGGDPDAFQEKLESFIYSAGEREPLKEEIRLGYLGVPSVFSGFYELIESLGARVVYNEVQRQFSMPAATSDIVEQYLAYTYPYAVEGRIRDIRKAIEERHLNGLIHYTQTFCYRQIYDILLRKNLSVPILTLEGDRPASLDSRTGLRIETFIQMLKDRKPSSG
jgi:benzoyl-CoA reductase/2-hydroxyglutaryl-CoA dehydratase subunit BcrC/BadD/HgdB